MFRYGVQNVKGTPDAVESHLARPVVSKFRDRKFKIGIRYLTLRDAGWLTEDRARAWCWVLAIVTAVVAVGYVATSHGGLDYWGKPIGTDFVSFWTASRLALDHRIASIYNPTLHEAAQRALFPTQAGYYAFFYPPTFLLLCLPLALLPYLAALSAWLVISFGMFYTCMRRLLPQRWAILPILASPGVLMVAGHGQNGLITAACFGWSMVLARRRPFLAGACLGVLVIKPHLLLASPVILLAGRRWTMIAGGVTSGLGLIALSWLVLGSAAWEGFLHVSPLARMTLEQGLVEPWKMQSIFAAVRLLHGSVGLAYEMQGALAIVVCVYVAWIAAQRPDIAAEGAILVSATLLCTPFLLDYDLVCLMLPIAWLAAQAQRTGWRAWEKLVLLAAYVLPIVARPIAMNSSVSVAPIVMAALLAVVVSRVGAARNVMRTVLLTAP